MKEENSSLAVANNDKKDIVKSQKEKGISYRFSIELSEDLSEEEIVEFLKFNLGDEEYALNILNIKEIIKFKEITEIPKAPPHLLGIVSLRGEIIPIIDLKKRLKSTPISPNANTRIIVAQNEEKLVGIVADSVSQVFKIHKKDIQPPPSVITGINLEFIQGIARYNGRLIILLNIERIFNIDLFKRE